MAHSIHLTAVRAKSLPAERVVGHRWSSLPLFAGKNRPACLEAGTVLGESGGLADTPAGWRGYVAYLAVLAEEDAKRRDEKFGRFSRGWMIGSAGFKADLKKELTAKGVGKERLELLGADREAQNEARAAVWEERLRAAATLLGVALDRLAAATSALEKVRLATVRKTATSVSNSWLAARLEMGAPSSVTQYERRFRLRGDADKRAFQTVLSKVHPCPLFGPASRSSPELPAPPSVAAGNDQRPRAPANPAPLVSPTTRACARLARGGSCASEDCATEPTGLPSP